MADKWCDSIDVLDWASDFRNDAVFQGLESDGTLDRHIEEGTDMIKNQIQGRYQLNTLNPNPLSDFPRSLRTLVALAVARALYMRYQIGANQRDKRLEQAYNDQLRIARNGSLLDNTGTPLASLAGPSFSDAVPPPDLDTEFSYGSRYGVYNIEVESSGNPNDLELNP